MKRPQSIAEMHKVFVTLMDYLDKNKDLVPEFSQIFNELLDDLHNDDFFGTEGQNDPRGDHRE